MKVKATDCVAVLTIISCTTLIALGKDTIVGYSLLAVIVGYFGIETWPIPQIRARKKGE